MQTAVLLVVVPLGDAAGCVTALYMTHDLGARIGAWATTRATMLPYWYVYELVTDWLWTSNRFTIESRCVWVLAAIQLGVGGAVLRRFGDVSTEVHFAALLMTDLVYVAFAALDRLLDASC